MEREPMRCAKLASAVGMLVVVFWHPNQNEGRLLKLHDNRK